MDVELHEQLEVCQSCGAESPPSKFCLSCGNPKTQENDSLVDVRVDLQDFESESIRHDLSTPVRGHIPTIDSEPAVQLKENLVDLKQNINRMVLMVDLLVKSNVEEEVFNNLFDSYEYRFEQNMKRRNKMLEIARDIKPMNKAFKEAKMRLSELELRKSIGDISDEEYNLKAPAYQWDIDKYENELEINKANILFLENFGHLSSDKEGKQIKEKTENAKNLVEEEIKKGNINQETGARITKVLDNILSGFKKPRKK